MREVGFLSAVTRRRSLRMTANIVIRPAMSYRFIRIYIFSLKRGNALLPLNDSDATVRL